ncbi:MAG: glycosyltransferase family 1 protein [Acidobacteriota bacterium]
MGFRVGGVREYARAMTEAMLELGSPHRFTIYYADPGLLGTFRDAQEIYLRAPHKFFWDHHAVPRRLKADAPDAVWFPHNVVGLDVRTPAVVTLHDLLYFRNPQFPIREYARLDSLYMRFFIPRSIRLAKKVISVSNWTAAEAERLLNAPRQKIRTIYHAASPIFRRLPTATQQEVERRYELSRPFFLYVGTLSPRKNPRRLLAALGEIKDQVPHDLVVTGGGALQEAELQDLIDKYGIGERFRKLGSIPQADLVALYNLAEAFVFPSLYEGFGIPPLEAFACDCPVISSSTTALGEVVGDAALIIDPYDTEDLARAMVEIIQNAELRKRLIAAGRERLSLFSWRQSARQLLDELEEIAG